MFQTSLHLINLKFNNHCKTFYANNSLQGWRLAQPRNFISIQERRQEKKKKFKQRTKTITMKGRKGWANRISGKAKKKKKRSNTKGIVNYRFDQPITAIPDTTTYYAIRWDKLCVIFAQCYCLRVKIFKIISQYIKQLQHNCGDSIFIKALFLYFSI